MPRTILQHGSRLSVAQVGDGGRLEIRFDSRSTRSRPSTRMTTLMTTVVAIARTVRLVFHGPLCGKHQAFATKDICHILLNVCKAEVAPQSNPGREVTVIAVRTRRRLWRRPQPPQGKRKIQRKVEGPSRRICECPAALPTPRIPIRAGEKAVPTKSNAKMPSKPPHRLATWLKLSPGGRRRTSTQTWGAQHVRHDKVKRRERTNGSTNGTGGCCCRCGR